MKILWISLHFLCMAWMYLFPIATPYDTKGFFYLILSTSLLILVLRNVRFQKPQNSQWPLILLSLPLIVASFIIPFPYNINVFLLLTAFLFYFMCHYSSLWSPFAFAFLLMGLIVGLQTLGTFLYYNLACKYHYLPIVSPIIYLINKLLGLSVAIDQSTIYVKSAGNLIPFIPTVEALALYPLMLFFLGALVFICFFQKINKISTFLSLSISILVYTILRFVYLVFFLTEIGDISILQIPAKIAMSLLPLTLFVMLFFPLNSKLWGGQVFNLKIRKKFLKTGFWVFTGILAAIACVGYHDPGVSKNGNILIDESHSRWEWSEVKLDKEHYGVQTVYNYYCLAEYLDHFYKVGRNFNRITPPLLKNYDILILKTPTKPYDEKEIEVIRDFVYQGGGLWLIGDHTNIFGMNTYLNKISTIFGIRYNMDALPSLIPSGQVYRHPDIFPHPIVQNLPPLLFATSCSLTSGFFTENVIIGSMLLGDKMSYSVNTFFGNFVPDPNETFGLFLQMAACKYGKGRVCCFTDSTIFSNFTIFIPGKPELALATVEWLNRKNKTAYLNYIFLCIFMFSVWKTRYCFRRFNVSTLFILLSFTFLALSIGVPSFVMLNKVNYPFSRQHTPFTEVHFEQEYSSYFLPIVYKERKNDPNSYHTFYVWTQRVGFLPVVKYSLQEAFKGDIIIIINPNKRIGIQAKENIIEYIKEGGRIFLLDDQRNKESTANDILSLFGMKMNYIKIKDTEAWDALTREKVCHLKGSGYVEGGTPVLVSGDGKTVLSVTQQGKGIIVVFANSYLFCDQMMGSTSVIPNEEQLQLSKLEFRILEMLMSGEKLEGNLFIPKIGFKR